MMKFKNATLLFFISIAFSQISVNEIKNLSSSELDAIRQQLNIQQEDQVNIENQENYIYSEMPEVSVENNSNIKKEIKYFGYNYFQQDINFFDNIPTPSDFKIGPGDELILSLWGENNVREKLSVSKDGLIYFENIGFVNISNKTLKEAESLLKSELSKIYATINDKDNPTNLQLELGKVRSINIYLTGQVTNPGISLVHPFSDIFTALVQSGGILEEGSLRRVELIRRGKVIKTVDFYSFFGSGIAEFQNIRLIDGDTINIPIFKNRVEIFGEVNKPMIYELLGSETLQNLIDYAGGLTSSASSKGLVQSVKPVHERQSDDNALFAYILDLNESSNIKLDNGASIEILPIAKNETTVTVFGRVVRPGMFPLNLNTVGSNQSKSSSLKDILDAAGGFDDPVFRKTINENIVVLRQDDQKFYSSEFLVNYNDSSEFKLEINDKIFVYEDINYRNSFTFQIEGEVNAPGTYPLFDNFTLKDAIQKSGGITEIGSIESISIKKELTELDFEGNAISSYEVVRNINLDYILSDGDIITVLPKTNVVQVDGNVYSPGLVAYNNKRIRVNKAVELAGGYKPDSLKRKAYIVRSNGEIEKMNIFLGRAKFLRPGDSVFIPANPNPTTFDITQFIADLSTTLANIAAILVIADKNQ